jgi:predicted phage tail protein
MKVVKVYGALRKKLGQCRFEFEAATPAQAIKALCVNFPGLEKWFIDNERDGVGYRVTIGKEKIVDDPSPLLMPWGEKEVFSITPVIAGAGRGAGSIFAGLGLVALAVVTGGASIGFTSGGFTAFAAGGTAIPFAAATFGTKLAIAAGTLGLGLTFMGIAQSLSPQPEVPQFDESAQLESFTFSNVVNTSRQGLPVPIAYGRVFVGSAIISSGTDVDEVRT